MIDFWKDYNPSSNEKIPSMRGIDYERIKAYCEVIGVDMYKQPINAKFMNEMEDWYLRLAQEAILIPNDATNSEILKMVFPNIKITVNETGEIAHIHENALIKDNLMFVQVSTKWLNAPYKKEAGD